MLYAIEYKTIGEDCRLRHSEIYDDFESKIKTLFPENESRKSKELRKEIIQQLKEKYPKLNIVIEKIDVPYRAEFLYKLKSYFRDNDSEVKRIDYIIKKSEEQLEQYEKSEEYDQDYTINEMLEILPTLRRLRWESEKYHLLDNQDFLFYMDELNKLSIDQDRPDTIEKGENLN